VLVGWAAVTNSLSWTPWLLFLLIFLWTPPHFWALAIRHQDDYTAAGVPMLPSVATPEKVIASMTRYTIALVIASLVVIPVADMRWVYGVSATLLGAVFLWGTIALGRRLTPGSAMKLFSFSISYISLLFVALTVDVFIR
jgi:protoheme IX farnesyltransferase